MVYSHICVSIQLLLRFYAEGTQSTDNSESFNTTLVKVLFSGDMDSLRLSDVSIQLLLRFYMPFNSLMKPMSSFNTTLVKVL